MWLVSKFNEGGIFMYFIFMFGILSFALIIERYFTLFKKETEAKSAFRNQLLTFISQGDFNGAIRFAETSNSSESASLTRIAKIGCTLRAQGAGDEEIQARMDEALSNEIHQLDRNTGFLGMFGNVATLLGLLGTITGMIHSFSAVASANPADRATMLSRGISEAMNCTAFGLIVAIPALVAFAVYQNKTDRMVAKLTGLTSEIFHDLLFLTAKRSVQATSVNNSSRSEAHPMN
jgi:biopolymer transport protein ExbB/TolQ